MAKLVAGLFSTPSGHNNGLIFGKARTQEGKKTTVRQYVVPANPRTAAQVTQRSKFSFAVEIAQDFIPQLNEIGWNGAVKNLPAFQGLVSTLTPLITAPSGAVAEPPAIYLGNLFLLGALSATSGTGEVTVTWNTAAGPHSSPDDTVHIALFLKQPIAGSSPYRNVVDSSATRGDGTVTFSTLQVSTNGAWIMAWAESNQVGIDPSSKFSQTNVVSVS